MDTIRHHEGHVAQPHIEEHMKGSEMITDIVIGMSDGLTVPFALAAGLSGAVDSSALILTAGIAEIVAGSIAMGLGGFLAGQTELEHYDSELKREFYEVENMPEKEKAEVKEIFAEYGLSESLQHEIVEEMSLDKEKWVDFMMKFELGLEKPHPKRATKSAMAIGLSYIVGGSIPLLPYAFTDLPIDGLKYSAIITLICLFIFGWFKSKVTGQPVWKGAFKVMSIGAVAAGAAYFVAKLFEM